MVVWGDGEPTPGDHKLALCWALVLHLAYLGVTVWQR